MIEKTPPANPILIIGAGLSGLTTARILTNHGIPNIIFEASTPDRSQGFSISLRDWGYSALLDGLGDVPRRNLTKGVAPDRLLGGSGWIDQALRDNRTGELLVAPDPATKQPIIRANRNALRSWIADCGDDELDVRYGHRLKSCRGQAGDVTAEFDNGARFQGSLIVAADGVHSTVRSLILPHVVPDIVPVVVYHGEFRLSRDEYDRLIRPLSGDSNILAGVGDGFNTPITVCHMTKTDVHLDWSYSRPVLDSKGKGEGEGAAEDPLYRPHATATEAKTIPPALLDELASRNLAAPWSTILNAATIPSHSVFHWTSRCVVVTAADVSRAAGRGVAFVGDAWHAMPIFGGEGGNHALVDGVELARAIVAASDPAAAAVAPVVARPTPTLSGDGDSGRDRDHDHNLEAAVTAYTDRAWRRCHDAVKRSRQRFYLLHRPMAEWREIAQMKGNGNGNGHGMAVSVA